ncbi:hypothetical protein HS7_01880 [Sulfolobales archaeon HS-7]|nr:hypothetical protein HS7_01880 [Sulfolobales archaeon HS-7]
MIMEVQFLELNDPLQVYAVVLTIPANVIRAIEVS